MRNQTGRGSREATQPRIRPRAAARSMTMRRLGQSRQRRAVAAYRRSLRAGNPLSERKLAQMFGQTSRRWARARITEARRETPLEAAGDSLR